MLPVMNVLRLSRFPIYHQLLLEEALLRGTTDNWLLVNDGAFHPAIVMGISGKHEELIHGEKAIRSGIQVIRRFSGGGTVVVDHDTVFTTLIVNRGQDHAPPVEPYPKEIMKWTASHFFGPTFSRYGDFRLQENDYAFGQLKFGGNAQSVTGKRWLHHTSFLWDYDPELMGLLKSNPPRAPSYRKGRDHHSFVVKLKDLVAPSGVPTELRRSMIDLLSTSPSHAVSR
jgi:lipoate-protein ligase A